MFTSLLKNIRKDTNEQPDAAIHRVISGWVSNAGALSRCSRGASLPQYMHLFTNLEASCPQPGLLGFLGRLRLVCMMGPNSIPSPSSLSGECGVGLKIPSF